MFDTGDTIVHPTHGVGVVVDINEREWRGSNSLYYQIDLLGREPSVCLMIPVEAAERLGLRAAIPQSQLEQLWRVLRSTPETLPANHKLRYKLLMDKLHGGDVFQVAEILRDLTWRRQKNHLTTRGKQVYRDGVRFLAGEIAAAQGIDITEAATQVRTKLEEISSSRKVA
jgi:CarD family transcriptional regulator